MISPTLLQDAIDLLTDVQSSTRPADAVTSAFFRSKGLDDAARGALVELTYALLRHRARLGWWLQRIGAEDSGRTRILAWLLLGEGHSRDAVRRLFEAARIPANRRLLEELPLVMEHADMPLAVRLECPDWALEPLQRRFGAEFAAQMAASLAPPPLDLRVNPVKTSRAAVLDELAPFGARPMALAPHGLRIDRRISLARLRGLKTGDIEIQDEGSQLVAELVGARPGERVVDFCAGAGGKTLAMAAAMANRGHLVACDVSEARLKRAAERLRKAGLHNVETRVLASETDKWVKRHKLGFDRVLVDAPCSGTGTWRRNPDARGRAPDLGLEGLVALQGRILASAARLVKPGGRLVYATCSVLTEENEDRVAAFLAATPGFRVSGDPLALTPLHHGTDGFFAVALTRD